jgi:hypothetical protein
LIVDRHVLHALQHVGLAVASYGVWYVRSRVRRALARRWMKRNPHPESVMDLN